MQYNYHPPQADVSEWDDVLGVTCDFEQKCMWEWDESLVDGFQVVSGINLTESNRTGLMPGPVVDGSLSAAGHFLHLRFTQDTTQRELRSPIFSQTRDNCHLEVLMHQGYMHFGSIKIVIVPEDQPESQWVPAEIRGDNLNQWQLHPFRIGRVSKDFRILFEVVPHLEGQNRGHLAIDNLRLVQCFPEGAESKNCVQQQVRCTSNKLPVCIKRDRICDIDADCDNKEDENLNCGEFNISLPGANHFQFIFLSSPLQTKCHLVAAVTLRTIGVVGSIPGAP